MGKVRAVSGKRAATSEEAAEQVVLASHVMGSLGDDLTLGHVSVRHSNDICMSIKRKGISGSEVTVEDVIEVRLDEVDCLDQPRMHLEAIIHTEIYRERPDVGAVIHGHPLYATALSATEAKVEFLTHDSVLFTDGIGRYNDSADLVTTEKQGKAVARSLGNCRATLLKNHGVVLVGEDIRYAVLAAVTLERALQIQTVANSLGVLSPLSDDQVRDIYPRKYKDLFLDEYWAWWARQFDQVK
jgi:L-fuculose-phosphate aldolase